MRKLNLEPISVLSWGYVVTALPAIAGAIISMLQFKLVLTCIFAGILIVIDYHFRLCIDKQKGKSVRRAKLTPAGILMQGYAIISLLTASGIILAISNNEAVFTGMFACILIMIVIIAGLSSIEHFITKGAK